MLSKGEAAALLSLINAHHGNAQWDDVQLDAFHSELRSDITAVEAREAVRRFYADNSTGRWCGSGDINGIVRKLRNGAKPSEAQIGRECERLGLVEDQAWLYRRQRMMGRSCVCSIESGPCERVDVFHVSGRFWSTSACGEKRTPARPAWTSFPS